MRKVLLLILAGILICSVAVTGCAQKKAESSKEAINTAKAMDSAEKQMKYLESQANAFLKAKEYTDAVELSNYVLRNLDKESKKAREILDQATKEMRALFEDKLRGIKE